MYFWLMFDISAMLYSYIVMRAASLVNFFLVQMKGKIISHCLLIHFHFSKSLSPCAYDFVCTQYFACTSWCPARTDGKVLEFLMVWRFSFLTTLNYSFLSDLTVWYFVLSASLRPSAYNIFTAHCSDFLTPLIGVMKGPYIGSWYNPSKILFSLLSWRRLFLSFYLFY